MQTNLPLDRPAAPGWVRVPFPRPAYLTLREAGDMRRDGSERAGFLARAGLDPALVHTVGQVHSREVVVAPRDTVSGGRSAAGEYVRPDADGLITDDPSILLAVTVADCMPIFIADLRSGARGLLHSGWKGTGILEVAIRLLEQEFGCAPANLAVTLGPCISAESYPVDDARARAFSAEWGDRAVVRHDGVPHLDLRAANEEICARCGVDLVNVIDHCTVKDDRLASFRRQGPDDYTLMMALLGGDTELEKGGT